MSDDTSPKGADNARAVLRLLRDDFVKDGFKEGRRCGAMRDGHYCPRDDLDFLLAYCNMGTVT